LVSEQELRRKVLVLHWLPVAQQMRLWRRMLLLQVQQQLHQSLLRAHLSQQVDSQH
jgi:hypothetical protein